MFVLIVFNFKLQLEIYYTESAHLSTNFHQLEVGLRVLGLTMALSHNIEAR